MENQKSSAHNLKLYKTNIGIYYLLISLFLIELPKKRHWEIEKTTKYMMKSSQ